MTGTAPQEAQADPQQEVYWLTDPENPVTKAPFVRAPVPQTERECPDCKGDRAGYKASCPTCSGTGKDKA